MRAVTCAPENAIGKYDGRMDSSAESCSHRTSKCAELPSRGSLSMLVLVIVVSSICALPAMSVCKFSSSLSLSHVGSCNFLVRNVPRAIERSDGVRVGCMETNPCRLVRITCKPLFTVPFRLPVLCVVWLPHASITVSSSLMSRMPAASAVPPASKLPAYVPAGWPSAASSRSSLPCPRGTNALSCAYRRNVRPSLPAAMYVLSSKPSSEMSRGTTPCE